MPTAVCCVGSSPKWKPAAADGDDRALWGLTPLAAGHADPVRTGLIRSSSGHTSPGGGSVISEAEALRLAETIIIEAAQQGTVVQLDAHNGQATGVLA